jgi:hypothetical protein
MYFEVSNRSGNIFSIVELALLVVGTLDLGAV